MKRDGHKLPLTVFIFHQIAKISVAIFHQLVIQTRFFPRLCRRQRHQHGMRMIGHHAKRIQPVAFAIEVMKVFSHKRSNPVVPEPKRPFAGVVQILFVFPKP